MPNTAIIGPKHVVQPTFCGAEVLKRLGRPSEPRGHPLRRPEMARWAQWATVGDGGASDVDRKGSAAPVSGLKSGSTPWKWA